MSTDCTTTCDVCDHDMTGVVYPWPVDVSDAGGASKDVCSPTCLLELAVCLIEDEARAEGLAMRRPEPARKRRWRR